MFERAELRSLQNPLRRLAEPNRCDSSRKQRQPFVRIVAFDAKRENCGTPSEPTQSCATGGVAALSTGPFHFVPRTALFPFFTGHRTRYGGRKTESGEKNKKITTTTTTTIILLLRTRPERNAYSDHAVTAKQEPRQHAYFLYIYIYVYVKRSTRWAVLKIFKSRTHTRTRVRHYASRMWKSNASIRPRTRVFMLQTYRRTYYKNGVRSSESRYATSRRVRVRFFFFSPPVRNTIYMRLR